MSPDFNLQFHEVDKKKKLIVVLGPTAVGKTSFAIKLARHFHTEILSGDSRQFYKELTIGVARPDEAELSQAIHHFVGFISIHDNYSAGMYERDALALLSELYNKHDVVVCCGGSMMYVNALLYGLDDLPSDFWLKALLKERYEKEGLEQLSLELKELDPIYYEEVDKKNPHRIIRAIEICHLTGEKYSDLRKSRQVNRDFEIIKIGLNGSREWLYDRINKRVDDMMAAGLEEEARSVYLSRSLNSLNTVGYKEMFDYFDGKMSLDDATNKIKQHTRNFAKRQLTWWRRDEEIRWLDAEKMDDGVLNRLFD